MSALDSLGYLLLGSDPKQNHSHSILSAPLNTVCDLYLCIQSTVMLNCNYQASGPFRPADLKTDFMNAVDLNWQLPVNKWHSSSCSIQTSYYVDRRVALSFLIG